MPTESFYGDASLAFIASTEAGKGGTAYSMKPTDGTGDFPFTRADDPDDGGLDLAATTITEDGYIEKAYENFILHSNAFGTSPWVSSSTNTLTPGQPGYDGTNDAWLITKAGAYGRVEQSLSPSKVQTLSIYVKLVDASLANGITLRADSLEGVVTANFNLENQSINSNQDLATSLEQIGNGGWYRCSVSCNKTTTIVRFYISLNGDTYLTEGSLYIQDAQLNQGLATYPYIESGTLKAQKGLKQDEPRFGFDINGAKSLMIEPERTNLANFSDVIGGVDVTAICNQAISPEGYKNASLIQENTRLSTHGISLANWFPQSDTPEAYTISVFAKYKERKFLQFQFYVDGASYNSVGFNLETGTTTGDPLTHSIVPYQDGWYRCSFTATLANTTGGYHFARANMGTTITSFYYTGNALSGMYLWGSQLEKGGYASSLIPTYSTSVTRFEEDLTSTPVNINFFGETEGTIFLEFSEPLSNGIGNNWFYLDNGNGRYMRVRRYWQFFFNDLTYNPTDNLGDVRGHKKILARWGNGVIKLFVDSNTGVGIEDASSTYTGGDINANGFLRSISGRFDFAKNNSNLKTMLFFPTALSDEDCITLTTI